MLSAVIGALGAGYIADKIGRKLMLAIGFVISFVGEMNFKHYPLSII